MRSLIGFKKSYSQYYTIEGKEEQIPIKCKRKFFRIIRIIEIKK